MLTQSESELINDLLLPLVSEQREPRQFLVAFLDDILRAQLPDGPPFYLVTTAIELCQRDGYRQNPPAMVQLLLGLLSQRMGIPEIIERIRTPPRQGPTPFDAVVLASKVPFLDRSATRKCIRDFLQGGVHPAILIVNGATKTGKSHTSEFIDHVCRHQTDVQHCRVELERGLGPSTGPRELAGDIIAIIGGDPRTCPPQHTNLERWTQELASWVISAANLSKTNWWFVLDGFNNIELRDDTRLFIIKLAKSLLTGVAQARHRLVLLDFDRTILPLPVGRIGVETTAGIPKSTVISAVENVVHGTPYAANAGAFASRITAGLPDPVTNLPELSSRIDDLIALVG